MSSARYAQLPQKELRDQAEQPPNLTIENQSSPRQLGQRVYVFLLISVILNIGQLVTLYSYQQGRMPEAQSQYVGLQRNVTKAVAKAHGSVPDESKLWQLPDFNPNLLTVAISVNWAAEQGLPATQPWPWDESMGIYSVQGMHLLHCTKSLHMSLQEFRDNRPQTWEWSHIQHCVQLLREDVMCNADDTLVYTGRLNGQEGVDVPVPGAGQKRRCRDWPKLYEWVRERSACYWPVRPTGPDFRESDKYKYCPDGRKHW